MKNSRIYLKTKDFMVTGESFDLVYNNEMHLLKTNPQPNLTELGKYYQSEEYISHTDERRGLLSALYQLVKKWSLRKKTKLIYKQNSGKGSLLDIGAGTGDFMKVADQEGWTVFGTEPNKNATSRAARKGIKLKNSIEEFKGEQFDVVTLWHVLEHIQNLEETVMQLTDLVKAGGTLIIAVPNFKSFDAAYYAEYWAAYDVPRHLWHFSKSAIEKLFSRSFKLEKVEPMIFDSFYVSLLSEKYKYGKSFSLNSFWIGFKSNWKAKTTGEYSSLIYCLKKTK